jgi:hypothetical protein
MMELENITGKMDPIFKGSTSTVSSMERENLQHLERSLSMESGRKGR